MKRNALVIILLALACFFLLYGCATAPTPMPSPPPPPNGECIWIPGKGCKKLAAGDSGTTVRGYHEQKDPEEQH